MFRFTSHSVAAVVAVASVVALAAQAPSPAGQPPSPSVRRTGNFSPIVESLEKSRAFYQGVLGLEIKGVDRQPLKTRIQDPGTVRMQLMVGNIDGMIAKLKEAGSTVVSDHGTKAALPPNLWGAMMPDPNNIYLSLLENCDGCAPRRPPQNPAAAAPPAAR